MVLVSVRKFASKRGRSFSKGYGTLGWANFLNIYALEIILEQIHFNLQFLTKLVQAEILI